MNKEKEKTCDTCIHRSMGFHQVNKRRVYTFECGSFEGTRAGRKVKLTDTCEKHYEES